MSKTRYTPSMRDVKPVSNPNLTDVNNTDQALSATEMSSGVPINYRPNFKVAGPQSYNPQDAQLAQEKFGSTMFNANRSGQDLRYKVAEDYSVGGNILRGGYNAAVAAVGGFVGSFVDPIGMGIDALFETNIQGGYHDLMDGIKAEVFASKEQDEAFGIEAMKSGTWWASSGADGIGMMVGFVASYALAGAGASKLLTYGLAANRVGQASGLASQMAKVGTVAHSRAVQGLTAVYMGAAESAMETYETSKMLKEKYAPLVARGIMSQEEADERIGSMTSAAFWSNMGVSITSNIIFGAVLGEYLIGQKIMGKSNSAIGRMEDGLHTSVGRLKDSLGKVGFKEGATNFGKATLAIGMETASEYGEEYAQTIIQNYIQNVSDLDMNLSQEDRYTWGELMGGIWGHMRDGWQLGEAEQAAFLGALLGGTSATAGKVGENIKYNKNRQKLYDYLSQNEQSLNNGFKNFYQKKDGELVLDEKGNPKIDWDTLRKDFKNVGSKVWDGLIMAKAMESGNYADVDKKIMSTLIIPAAFAYINMRNNGKERYLESIKKVFEAHGYIKAGEPLPEALEKQYTEVYDMLKEENDKTKEELPETIASAISALRSDQGFLSRMFYGEKSSNALKSNAQLTSEQRKEFKTKQESYIEAAQKLSSEYSVRMRIAKQQLEDAKKALEEVYEEDPTLAGIDPDPANQTEEQKKLIAKEEKRKANFESRQSKTLPQRVRALQLELEQLNALQSQLLDPKFIQHAFKDFTDKPVTTYMNEYQGRVKSSYDTFIAELEKLGHIQTVKDEKGKDQKEFTGKSAVVVKDSKGDLWKLVPKMKGKKATGNFYFERLEPKANAKDNRVDMEYITLDSYSKSKNLLTIENVLNPDNILSVEEAQKIMNNREIAQVNKDVREAIESLIKNINKELKKAKSVYNSTPEELAATKKRLEKLASKKIGKPDLAAINKQIQELEKQLEALNTQKGKVTNEDDIAIIEAEITKLNAKKKKQASIASLLEEIKEVEAEIKRLEASYQSAERVIGTLRAERAYLEVSLANLEVLLEQQKAMDLSSDEAFVSFKLQPNEKVGEFLQRTAPDLVLTLEKARASLKQTWDNEIAGQFINFTPETLAYFTQFENDLLKSKADISRQIGEYKGILAKMRKFLAMKIASAFLGPSSVLNLYKNDPYFKKLYDQYSKNDDILKWSAEIPRPIANPNLTPHQQREQQKILDIKWKREEEARKQSAIQEFSKILLDNHMEGIVGALKERTTQYLKTRGLIYKQEGNLATIDASLMEMYQHIQDETKMEDYLKAAEGSIQEIDAQLSELYNSAEYTAANLGKAVSRIRQVWTEIEIILQNGIKPKSRKDRYDSNPEQDAESLLAHVENMKGKTHKKGSMYSTINGILKEGKTIAYRDNPSSINATKWINNISTRQVEEKGMKGSVFNGEQLKEILSPEQLEHGLPFTKDDLYLVPTVNGNPEKYNGMVVFFGIAKVSTYFPNKNTTTINASSLYQKHLEKHRTPEEKTARKQKVVTLDGDTVYPSSKKEALKIFIEKVMKPEYTAWIDSLKADINNAEVPVLEINYVSKGMHILNKDADGNLQMQEAKQRFSKAKHPTRPRVVVNSRAFSSGHKITKATEEQAAKNGLLGSVEGSKFGSAALVLPNDEVVPVFNKKVGKTVQGEKLVDFIVKAFGYLGQPGAKIGDTWVLGQKTKIDKDASKITMFPKGLSDSILNLFINVKRQSGSEISSDKDSANRQLVDYEISVYRDDLGRIMIAYKPKGEEKVIIDPKDLVIVEDNGIPLIDHTNPVVAQFVQFLKDKPHNIDARALTPASFFHKKNDKKENVVFAVPDHINYKTRRIWAGNSAKRYEDNVNGYEAYIFEEVAQVSVAEEVNPDEPKLVNRYLSLSPYKKSESAGLKEASVSKQRRFTQEEETGVGESEKVIASNSAKSSIKVITSGASYFYQHSVDFQEKIKHNAVDAKPVINANPGKGITGTTLAEFEGKSVYIFSVLPETESKYRAPLYKAKASFLNGSLTKLELNPLLDKLNLPTSLSQDEIVELQGKLKGLDGYKIPISILNFLATKGYAVELPNSYEMPNDNWIAYENAAIIIDESTNSQLANYAKEIPTDDQTISCA